jgi:hypothetical protein
LVQQLTPLDGTLTNQEKKRNSFGTDHVVAAAPPSSLSPSPYRIHQSPLSPQDIRWVRRRSGFAIQPKPQEKAEEKVAENAQEKLEEKVGEKKEEAEDKAEGKRDVSPN